MTTERNKVDEIKQEEKAEKILEHVAKTLEKTAEILH
jgi:translation initiation factor 2 alpha subunit (eIF-2alpha)